MDVRLDDRDIGKLADLLVDRLVPLLASRGGGASPAREKRLYTEREAAELLGVSVFSLKRWRQQGVLRAATKKRPILYSPELIDEAAKRLGERGESI